MIVIGIDPGLANTGVAVVAGRGDRVERYSYGTIRTDAGVPVADRLGIIYEELRQVVREHTPDLLVVEDIFTLPRFPKSAVTLGKVTGAVLLACRHTSLPVMEVAVREAKRVLTGNGAASKNQLERAVRDRLNRTEAVKPSHAADALALALIGLYRGPGSGFRERVTATGDS